MLYYIKFNICQKEFSYVGYIETALCNFNKAIFLNLRKYTSKTNIFCLLMFVFSKIYIFTIVFIELCINLNNAYYD